MIIFITKAIENIPLGWKAKETWQIVGGGSFSETFELAEPGKDFTIYTKTQFSK